MEFEKGKYYEYHYDVEHSEFMHCIMMAEHDGMESSCMVLHSFDDVNKKGEQSIWSIEIKPINVFNNIHEVSKRVKELEKEELKKGDYNEALNLKEASEKAGKACKEYGEAINMATNSEIVSVTKMEPSEEVKAILPELSKLHKEAMHEIVLQLKEKYLS